MIVVIKTDIEKLISAFTGLSMDDFTMEILKDEKLEKGKKDNYKIQETELDIEKKERIILNAKQAMEHFKISQTTILQLFKSHGSPAFKVGKNWRVDEDDFKKFLIKQAEKYKG